MIDGLASPPRLCRTAVKQKVFTSNTIAGAGNREGPGCVNTGAEGRRLGVERPRLSVISPVLIMALERAPGRDHGSR